VIHIEILPSGQNDMVMALMIDGIPAIRLEASLSC
jgi:hypothetical protein